MRGVRDHVAQVEQVERALVRDHRRILAHGQPGGEYVLARGRGVLAVAVAAAADADEPAALDVVREERPAVAARSRLLSGEVATLLRGDLEEPGAIGPGGGCKRRRKRLLDIGLIRRALDDFARLVELLPLADQKELFQLLLRGAA